MPFESCFTSIGKILCHIDCHILGEKRGIFEVNLHRSVAYRLSFSGVVSHQLSRNSLKTNKNRTEIFSPVSFCDPNVRCSSLICHATKDRSSCLELIGIEPTTY